MATTSTPQLQALVGRKRLRRTTQDYKTACFCVLDVELAALRAMLDEVHEDIPTMNSQNAYILGELSRHNVVIAILPVTGNNDSGAVAKQLRIDFPFVQYGILVGVGGGVPNPDLDTSIHLGDVIVGEASSTTPAVVQFDRGKIRDRGELEPTGHLNKPPPLLVGAVKKLKAQHRQEGSQIPSLIVDMVRRYPWMEKEYRSPGAGQDQLFSPSYEHVSGSTCQQCNQQMLIRRETCNLEPNRVHYGTIGSSNSVVRNATERDRLAQKHGVICVEMEAAGLVDQLPCLVVRGVCDYADSHKHKQWQPHAAAAAAAYVRELLGVIQCGDTSRPSTTRLTNDHSNEAMTDVPGPELSDDIETKLKIILESLGFQRMDARLRNISKALPQTCTWLAVHQSFKEWNDANQTSAHHGFLWIKGKPGSGKSTLMKSLLASEQRKRSRQTVINYFFNARAPGELEKSSLGLYRSLTHQLVTACPYIQNQFLEWFSAKESVGIVDDWTADELKDFLVDMISSHLSQPLVILIDALDEGQESDIRQLVTYLEDLSSHAYSSQQALRICLSSRHYPYISIKRGISVTMEIQPGHENDIKRYIREKLPDHESLAAEELRDKLSRKSNGVFLWVVLVMRLLKEAHDHGDPLDATAMSCHLDSIPEELDDLFARILAKNVDDLSDCVTTLQWVLFSQRPLNITQLYVAVSVTSTSTRFDVRDTSTDRVVRCLIDASRGLTEITGSQPPVVQFIHETVRDFLKRSGLAQIDARLSGNIEGLSHKKLVSCCCSYILQNSQHIPDVLSLSRAAHDNQKSETCARLPLLRYAALYMFRHAELAENQNVSQKEFLRQLAHDTQRLSAWIRARNVFEQTIINRYTRTAPLCYVLVDQGLEALSKILEHDDCRDTVSAERYGTALQAACVKGNEELAAILIANGHDVNIEGGQYQNAIFAALKSKSEPLTNLLLQRGYKPSREVIESHMFKFVENASLKGVQFLIEAGCPVDCTDSSSRTPLLYACLRESRADFESMPLILQSLIEAGADVDARGGHHGNALQAATVRGNINLVKLLLETGADVNAKGGEFGGALKAAVWKGHEDITRLLLEAGANVYASGGKHNCVFKAAAYGKNRAVMRLLLEAETVINTHKNCNTCTTALQSSATAGNEHVVMLLLEAGVDVNARESVYGNVLQAAAAARAGVNMVKLLLDAGADVNAQGGTYGNALQAAISRGDTNLAKLLLDAGADVNAQGGAYGSVLRAALSPPNRAIIHLLFEAGAVIDTQKDDIPCTTALLSSALAGDEHVVRLLLEAGVDVNVKGDECGSALQAAVYRGHENVIRLLLERGADVNVKGSAYDNVLQVAAAGGSVDLVKLLVEAGADVNAHGGYYGSALQAAIVKRNDQVAWRLLALGADVDMQGGLYGNALQAATLRGNKNQMQRLLDAGADVDAHGGLYNDAFPSGVIAKALRQRLWHTSNLKTPGGWYLATLCDSVRQRGAISLPQLVQSGEGVGTRISFYGTALCAAASNGSPTAVQLLLRAGANVNAPGGEIGSALRVSVLKGDATIAQLLLEEGADVDALDNKCRDKLASILQELSQDKREEEQLSAEAGDQQHSASENDE